MKDAAYVLGAAIGLLLVGMGTAEINASRARQPQSSGFPEEIRHMMERDFPLPAAGSSSTAGMVPVAAVCYLLFGYLLQIGGCVVYATNRGRSGWFGLLGLLSPIGYVFLSLLNPAPRASSPRM